MTESVGQSSWKATRALRVVTAVLFIAVLVSGVLARVERARDRVQGEQTDWIAENFILSLCVFLLVAAIAVYGIRRPRRGRAQRRVADLRRSLEIGLAVGLALSAVVLASVLISFGGIDDGKPVRRGDLRHYVNLTAGVPGVFAEEILIRSGFLYTQFGWRVHGFLWLDGLYATHRLEPYPDKQLQAWIEVACLNTLGWWILLSPAVHLTRWRSRRRSPKIDARL